MVLGGPPGAGKTTIARALARRVGAAHIRVDTIEVAIARARPGEPIDDTGYEVAYAVAGDQLGVGRLVVADTVNPLAVTRAAWRQVATSRGLPVAEVDIRCSDETLHRRRAQERPVDIEGFVLPTWQEIQDREIEPWDADLRIDTAELDVDAAVDLLVARLPWLTRGPDGTGI